MKKRIVSLLLAAVMVTGMLAGCGNSSKGDSTAGKSQEDKVELTVMFSGGDQSWKKSVESVAQQFMAVNQDVSIKLEPSGSGVYDDFLKTKDAVGEFGDVVELKGAKTYAQSGKVIELPENITSLIETPIIVDDKIYGVPTATNTQGIIYNKKIFTDLGLEEPKTYAEFLDICQKIKDSGVDPLVVGASDLWHMGFWVNGFFRNNVVNNNPDFLKQRTEGKVSWTDPDPTKMMEDVKALFDKGYVQDGYMSTADSQTAAILTSGTAAMLFSGPWMFSQLEEADADFEYGFFFVPNDKGIRTIQNSMKEMGITADFDMKELLEKGRNVEDFEEMSQVYKQYYLQCYEMVVEAAGRNENKPVLEAKKYIDEHYQENLSLDILADLIHMNAYYFSSYFKKNTGMNFKEYLNEVRLKYAVSLLISSDKNVSEIAGEVGFCDVRSFTKAFHKKYDDTPGNYKKRILKGLGGTPQ